MKLYSMFETFIVSHWKNRGTQRTFVMVWYPKFECLWFSLQMFRAIFLCWVLAKNTSSKYWQKSWKLLL